MSFIHSKSQENTYRWPIFRGSALSYLIQGMYPSLTMNPFCFPLHNFFGRCTLPHLCVCATKCRKLNRKPNHRGFRERSRSHGSQTWAGQKILNATLIFLFIKAKKRKMRGTKDYIEDGLLNFLRYLLTPNVDPFCILLIKGLLRLLIFFRYQSLIQFILIYLIIRSM